MPPLVGVLTVLLVAACGTGSSARPSAATVAIPTFGPLPSGECPAAQLAGLRLRGATSASPAAWVEDDQGKKLSIIWPNGFSARFDPSVSLIGPRGDVVARDGDVLDLTGGQVDPAYDFFACAISNRTASH